MKKSEAIPGTKVIASYHYGKYDDFSDYSDGPKIGPYHHDEYGDSSLVGVIRSKKASTNKVWVKWIEGELVDEEDQEVDLKVLSLESNRFGLEKEFKQVEKLVKEKMKEAAALVNEAGKLAKKAHVESLESMYSAVSPLVNAMDNNGWRSSSWSC